MDGSERLENVGKMLFHVEKKYIMTHSTIAGIRIYMVKKPSKMGRTLAKRGKFDLFYCKDLLKIGQNVGKNGLPTCFLHVTYMDKMLIISFYVDNVGM